MFTVPMHAHRPVRSSLLGRRRDGQPLGDVRQVHITYIHDLRREDGQQEREMIMGRKRKRDEMMGRPRRQNSTMNDAARRRSSEL